MATVIDTPEGIAFFHLCQLRAMVRLEMVGMRRRGRSATVEAKELLGLPNSAKRPVVLGKLNDMIEGILLERARG